MPVRKCRYPGCGCKDGLTEVTAEQESFCKALCDAQFGWNGFQRYADSGIFKAKTWLCEKHTPRGLAEADVLGARVARIDRGQLQFGEVISVAGHEGSSRFLDQRVGPR